MEVEAVRRGVAAYATVPATDDTSNNAPNTLKLFLILLVIFKIMLLSLS
jgi:hypothetical protein